MKASTKKTPEEYAAEIEKVLGKSVPDILRAGALCAEAQQALDKTEQEDLKSRLKERSEGDFSKYAKIGKAKGRLSQIEDKLPPCYTIIYLIARMTEAVLNKAVADGVIHPRAKREDIKAILPTKTRKERPILLGSLHAKPDCPPETQLAVVQALSELAAEYGDMILLRDCKVAAKSTPTKVAA